MLQGASGAPAIQNAAPLSQVQRVAPSPAPAAKPAPNSGSTATGASGASSNPYAINAPLYIQGIQEEYSRQLAADQAQAGANTAGFNTNNADVNATAGANENQINQQASDSANTLATQKSGVESQRALSLSELADQIHGQHQALLNELGTVGAGSSSAVGTGEGALAKVQNTGTANIQENAGTQEANISAEQQAVEDQRQAQLQSLAVWKAQQLHQIMQTYISNQNAIASAIGTAQGEEKARLAEFGQSLTQVTSSALQAVDKTVQATVANLTKYEVAQAPGIKAPVALSTPAAITAPTVSPFNVGNGGAGAGNNTAAPTTPTGGSVYALMGNNNNNQNQL